MVQPFPAPSLRELLSAAKLRECSLMNVSGQRFQSLYALVGNRWHGGTIGGHSLSHALWACQLPQGGSRERLRGVRTIQPGTCETARFRAIFIAPTKALVILPFAIQPGTCETARFRAIFIAPTEGGCHSSCRSETARLRAIFIAPTKLRGGYILPFIGAFSSSEGSGYFTFYHLLGGAA